MGCSSLPETIMNCSLYFLDPNKVDHNEPSHHSLGWVKIQLHVFLSLAFEVWSMQIQITN